MAFYSPGTCAADPRAWAVIRIDRWTIAQEYARIVSCSKSEASVVCGIIICEFPEASHDLADLQFAAYLAVQGGINYPAAVDDMICELPAYINVSWTTIGNCSPPLITRRGYRLCEMNGSSTQTSTRSPVP